MPIGDPGEIWMKGPNVIRGYWNKPEATAETIVDGWLRTGDLGRMDDEGFVYIEDRAKDMVLRGGENVYCSEVEAAIYEHHAVHEAAVFGVPHERLGEEVAAAVVPKRGERIEVDELQAFVGERLAKFKVPTVVAIFNDPLPRNPAGKILKRQLRDQLSSDRRLTASRRGGASAQRRAPAQASEQKRSPRPPRTLDARGTGRPQIGSCTASPLLGTRPRSAVLMPLLKPLTSNTPAGLDAHPLGPFERDGVGGEQLAGTGHVAEAGGHVDRAADVVVALEHDHRADVHAGPQRQRGARALELVVGLHDERDHRVGHRRREHRAVAEPLHDADAAPGGGLPQGGAEPGEQEDGLLVAVLLGVGGEPAEIDEGEAAIDPHVRVLLIARASLHNVAPDGPRATPIRRDRADRAVTD